MRRLFPTAGVLVALVVVAPACSDAPSELDAGESVGSQVGTAEAEGTPASSTSTSTARAAASASSSTTSALAPVPSGDLPSIPRTPDAVVADPTTCDRSHGAGVFFRVHPQFEPVPSCIRAAVTDALTIDNDSGREITVDLGETNRVLPPGTRDTFDGAVLGDLLDVGAHQLADDLPVIWLVDPSESVFGSVNTMTLRSFGGLRTNMTVGEAEASLGVDLVDASEYVETGCSFVEPVGPTDPYAPSLQVFHDGQDLDTGRIVRIETANPAISTPSGVRVGQPESLLIETYGDRLIVHPHGYGDEDDHYYEWVPTDEADAGFRLMFETWDGLIVSMWTATTEAAYLIEGCA